jgi:hypothetical protein
VCFVLCGLHAAIGCSDSIAVIGTYQRPTTGGGGEPGVSDAGAPAAVGGSGGHAGAIMTGTAGAADAGGNRRDERLRIVTGSRDQFCAGHGPALASFVTTTDGGSEPQCTAGVARRLFSYALCSCGDLTLTGGVATIDMFDSRQGPYSSREGSGSIGVNASLSEEAGTATMGTAVIAGSGFLATGPMSFYGDVKSNAAINLSGFGVSFQRDLWVNADIHGILTATVQRDVYQTAGFSGADSLPRSGSLYRRDVAVPPPCPCRDAALLDIAGIVASARTDNDNDDLGVSSAALTTLLSSGSAPAGFACGRFALGSVEIGADFSSATTGRMALFVDGDLTLHSDFGASLEPGAELDVFVTGDLRLAGPGRIGTETRPAALRLYIAGAAPLSIDDTHPLAVQIYAPHAPIVMAMTTKPVLGAIFAARIETQGVYTMHYDRAISEAGEQCSGASPTPAKLLSGDACHACPGGLADLGGGVCGTCARDADCCEPMACVSGLCQPLVLQ